MESRIRKQIFGISIKDQCDLCIYGTFSDLFPGEYLCDKECDEILYPEPDGTNNCPYFE